MNYAKKNNGKFFIDIDTFYQCFGYFQACFLEPESWQQQYMVSMNDDGQKKRYTFKLDRSLPKIYIMLDTYDNRMFPVGC